MTKTMRGDFIMQEKQIYISQKSILFLLDQLAEQFDNELQRKQRGAILLVRQYILNASAEHSLICEQPDLIDRSLLKQAFEQMEEKSFISGWYSEKIRNLIDSIPRVNDTVKIIIEKGPEVITLDISDTGTEENNQ